MRHGEVTNVHDALNSVFSWGFLYSFQSYHINSLLEGIPTDSSYLPRHTWKSPEDGVKAKAGILALILVICNQKIDRWEREGMRYGEWGDRERQRGWGERRRQHARGMVLLTSVYNCSDMLDFLEDLWFDHGFSSSPLSSSKNAPNRHRGLEDFAIFSCTVSAYLWVFIW